MITRILAALVGLVLFVPALLCFGAPTIEVVLPPIAWICVTEYAAMAFPDEPRTAAVLMGVGWTLLYAALAYGPVAMWPAAVVVVLVGLLIAFTLWPGAAIERATDRLARATLGLAWLSLMVTVLWVVRSPDGVAWVFVAFLSSWLGDTGAYFAGRAFGRHALYPMISPKKTWEGIVGGALLATLGILGMRAFVLTDLDWLDCLVLGPVLYAVGVLGDLAESMMKRSFGVKDSGRIMPGHGGLLDRLDSLLLVAPVVYAWMSWTGAT